jgi:hypothetical protein
MAVAPQVSAQRSLSAKGDRRLPVDHLRGHGQPTQSQTEKLGAAVAFDRLVDRSPEQTKTVLEIWKQTVSLQQHFNDLQLRITDVASTPCRIPDCRSHTSKDWGAEAEYLAE